MRLKMGILVTGLLLSAPASAQSYNGFVMQPEYNFSSSDMSWSYGGVRQSAETVLAQLRARCSSDRQYDQYYCRRGMKVLNKAYAEYKLRKAAEAIAAE